MLRWEPSDITRPALGALAVRRHKPPTWCPHRFTNSNDQHTINKPSTSHQHPPQFSFNTPKLSRKHPLTIQLYPKHPQLSPNYTPNTSPNKRPTSPQLSHKQSPKLSPQLSPPHHHKHQHTRHHHHHHRPPHYAEAQFNSWESSPLSPVSPFPLSPFPRSPCFPFPFSPFIIIHGKAVRSTKSVRHSAEAQCSPLHKVC